MPDLLELEIQGWQALSSSGEAGQKFYSSVLCEDAVMLLPGGLFLRSKAAILSALAVQPWHSFQIEAPQVIALGDQAGALVYRVVAQRLDSPPYVALINSTYVHREGQWQLLLHQQTIIE